MPGWKTERNYEHKRKRFFNQVTERLGHSADLRFPKGLYQRENDKKLREFGKNKTEEVMRAAGNQEIVQEAGTAGILEKPATLSSRIEKMGLKRPA